MELSFFDQIWAHLLEFTWLILLALPLGLLLAFVGGRLSAEISWQQRRIKVLGVLYQLTTREQLLAAVGLFRLLFIAVILLFGIYMQLSHTLLYILLFVCANGLSFAPKKLVFDFLNSSVVYVALVVSNLLIGFYRDATGDGLMLIIYILLAIFILQYALYFYLKSLYTLLQEKAVPLTGTIGIKRAENHLGEENNGV